VEKLDMAYAVVRVPSLGLWLARALVRGGRLVEAAQRYREASELPIEAGNRAVQAQAKSEAAAELAQLRPRIPQLNFQLEGAVASELAILVDGTAVPVSTALGAYAVDPGEHEIEAHKGPELVRAKVRLSEGQSETVRLRFAPTSPADAARPAAPPALPTRPEGPSAARTLGWAAAIAGGASLAVGALTGGLAAANRSAIMDDPDCEKDRCPPSKRDEADSLNTLRTVSSVTFIAGGLLAGTGIVLLLTSESAEGRTEAFLSPTSAGVRGRF
jgi:hypothetical protein